MTLITALAAIAAFLIAFSLLRIVQKASEAVTIATGATGTIRNPDLNDSEKEKAIQAAALSMMRASGGLIVRVTALIVASLLPIYLFDFIGLSDKDNVIDFLADPWVILVTSVVIGGIAWAYVRAKRNSGNYSPLDQLLHRLAFGAPFLQITAADMEQTMFRRELDQIEKSPPIFVTSLPRAGTTVVLNALHDVPGVGTHLYRDMPFVMAPMLWNRFGRAARQDIKLKERAHGDGLMIGPDSAEAFEEVLWRNRYPEHFTENGIKLWQARDKTRESTDFFNTHFRKIIALRTTPDGRYVSKNNGNIARLDLLPTMFPDCTVIVPFRDPAEHAASLHRQHLNFLKQHNDDPFAKRYMDDIGHLEFGALHRPVEFEGMQNQPVTPDDLNYWLTYWIACFEHVLKVSDSLHLVSETALQKKPQKTMERLCEIASLDVDGIDFTEYFRKIDKRADLALFDTALLKRAKNIYAKLAKLSV